MNKFLILVVASILLFVPSAYGHSMDANTAYYNSEVEAHQHCPKDIVVWLNTLTGIYHFKGQRWYANTKKGVYVCQQEANQIGDRATRNGQ